MKKSRHLQYSIQIRGKALGIIYLEIEDSHLISIVNKDVHILQKLGSNLDVLIE